jgi:D-alanyl-D-alanine carboxypeptidase (penicillin-binding protein 5/6)
VSVTAERDGLSLICVIMGAESRDVRNAMATKLLDWGFANYAAYRAPGEDAGEVRVLGGVKNQCPVAFDAFDAVVGKGEAASIERKIILDDTITAPVRVGDEVGRVQYLLGDQVLGEVTVTAREDIKKISFWGLWQRLLAKALLA